jgi:hypothetical protein
LTQHKRRAAIDEFLVEQREVREPPAPGELVGLFDELDPSQPVDLPSLAERAAHEAGSWLPQALTDEPEGFRGGHFIVAAGAPHFFGRGAVVTGELWDGTSVPAFEIAHGWVRDGEQEGNKFVHSSSLAYLGRRWDPRYVELFQLMGPPEPPEGFVFVTASDRAERA